MLNKYKHIIWDWNGTILDDVDLCVELINELLAARSLRTISKSEYKNIFTIPVKNYYADLGFDFDAEPFEVVGREWMDRYEKRKFECRLYEGIEEVLEHNSRIGTGQSILSAYSQHTLEDLVEHFGLTKYFTHIVGLDNIYAASKLHLGRDLIKRLGNGKGETLLIGDTLHDLEVAVEIGADCILVSDGHQSSEKLSPGGVRVVESVKNLL